MIGPMGALHANHGVRHELDHGRPLIPVEDVAIAFSLNATSSLVIQPLPDQGASERQLDRLTLGEQGVEGKLAYANLLGCQLFPAKTSLFVVSAF